ncbi:WD40-repeat-containing domain protein [Lasiosphaeria miniovina]|uniref:WD40-repeat-containing domain protein n=1 Tax=Lasiosphaeria miniovina TaxID=1954250 RepID=A0AA39ZR05_9PEZI|nr:WD40-repeat-containing domain protein [Lasiosphaeria miniovina]KAK0702089.1 WD40-repeat-containing domain protein [Lasiosphaeria miniovina]
MKAAPPLTLLASTSNPDGSSPHRSKDRRPDLHDQASFFRSVQWSADGSTLFTTSSSNRICSFVLSADLLEPRQEPTPLNALGTLILPEATSAVAPCPYFSIRHLGTQVLLTSCADQPIQLHYAFLPSPESEESVGDGCAMSLPPPHSPPPIASYRLIKQETEEYMPVSSLIWPAPGTHFIAGTLNRIALYDISRSSAVHSEPILTIRTIPSRKDINNSVKVTGLRGHVSALAVQPDASGVAGMLAAGTRIRDVGLYDLKGGTGLCLNSWNVERDAAKSKIGGLGIMQTIWSPCGRYLAINERKSSGLLVYDVRSTSRLLAYLTGRNGETPQRMSCDVFQPSKAEANGGGFELWAGTMDGTVVVWEGVGRQEGAVKPSWDWKAHGSSVGGAALHSSGSVVATCSGSLVYVDDESSDESESDSSGEPGGSGESHMSVETGSASNRARRPRQRQHKRFVPKPPAMVETSLKLWSVGAKPAGPSHAETAYHGDDNHQQLPSNLAHPTVGL